MCTRPIVTLPVNDCKSRHLDPFTSRSLDENMVCTLSSTVSWCQNYVGTSSLLASRHEFTIVGDSITNVGNLASSKQALSLLVGRNRDARNRNIIGTELWDTMIRCRAVARRFPAHFRPKLDAAPQSSPEQYSSDSQTNAQLPVATAAARYGLNANDPPFSSATGGALKNPSAQHAQHSRNR